MGPGTGSPAASPCHGYVYSFKKVSGVVRMNDWICCSRKVDTVTCRNTNVCSNLETLKDRSGSQSYFGRAYEGDWPPATYVQDNGNTWRCNASGDAGLRCGGAGKKF